MNFNKYIIFSFTIILLLSCTSQPTAILEGEVFYISKTGRKDSLIYTSFYDNGKEKYIISIKNGIEHGPFLYRDKFGEIILRTTKVEGKLHGKSYSHASTGELEVINYFLKDSSFYGKNLLTGIEQINPILALRKDSVFVGDTITLQYRVPFYDEIAKDKLLYIFMADGVCCSGENLDYPIDSFPILGEKPKQIGLKMENKGSRMIYGFLANRQKGKEVNYNLFKKPITVYSK